MRIGMEASGHARWFERLLTEWEFELLIGTKRGFAPSCLLFKPLMEDRDLRLLLWHRRRLVQMRTHIVWRQGLDYSLVFPAILKARFSENPDICSSF